MKQRILIFTGGRLGDWATKLVQPQDYLIGADSGALFLIRNGFTPDIAIGDFDSVTGDELAEIRLHSKALIDCDPIDKDFTDTEMAFRRALEQQPSEIALIGALGTRFDHSLANVHLLSLALEQEVAASIIDEHNQIRLAQGPQTLSLNKGNYAHVSLLPLSQQVTGIYLTGFQYPLADATLQIGQSLGISNVILDDSGTIRFAEGILLIIQSKD
ncbi:thiamine diphosphokinase [Paenibacillus gorillae]|uniref:thiamine diphosphokinase n=1 Tax=Paenibacillus gorillae TaxID=1243662 RepID=UPI0004AF537E|nr:thiamine diphosphokinase [Paenibacillus gorillae]